MTPSIDQPITEFHRIAKRLGRPFGRLGIATVGDLLNHLPTRHEDLRSVIAIRDIRIGARVVVHGKVVVIANRRSPRQRMALTEALIADATGSIRCVWFHQPYLAHAYGVGSPVAVAGVAVTDGFGLHFVSPLIELRRGEGIHTSRMIPIYPLTSGISQKQIRTLIHAALPYAPALPETLPETVRTREHLLDRASAIRAIHFPDDDAVLARARERMAFEEAFAYFRAVRATREELASACAPCIPFDETTTREIVARLPFALTEGQRRAAWDVLCDMSGTTLKSQVSGLKSQVSIRPMQRLVNGDVGSGKTVVAAIAAANVARAGAQAAVLAPTEILAVQHARTLHRWLAPFGIRVALWTRTEQQLDGEPVAMRTLATAVANGSASVVVGTHVLAGDRVRFASLSLAIVDEQHRFGVAQRAALRTKRHDALVPHLLSMTATPIPRTLSIALFGDLDVSVLRERPPGRSPVATAVVGPDDRVLASTVAQEIDAGRQVFVVCPQIDADADAVSAVVAVADRMRSAYPHVRTGLLHGKLRPTEQRAVMAEFAARTVTILVATTVIEVGVDQPNATVMIIEDAERFGLAQLHQLRGRVGRGDVPGHCFLVTRNADTASRARLDAVARCTNGFQLAEVDLRERGPGAVMGTVQSGWPSFRFASMDPKLFARVRESVDRLTTEDCAQLDVRVAHLE